jgi:hypothetical protein
MIVARFTPATGWAGKAVTYDDGQFALEDYGLVAAGDVVRYDQLGQLAWEYDGLRDWVYQMAAGATGFAAAGGFPERSYAADARYAEMNRPPSPPGIAVAGFVLAVAGFVVPVGVLWWVGLGLSWPGYTEAVRQKLPSGLALAGLIINAVMTVLSVVFLLFVIMLTAVG